MIRSAFTSRETTSSNKPVVFDILAPDGKTSLLSSGPDNDYRLMLHVNPSSLRVSHQKNIQRLTTRGGFVEQHFGEQPVSLSIEAATGGFVHVEYGYISNTASSSSKNVTRRQTLAYDKFLDMLSLFKNNGAIYDSSGLIVFQGIIRVTFDGHTWDGWFQSFSVNESAEKPYMFNFNCEFTVDRNSYTNKIRPDFYSSIG